MLIGDKGVILTDSGKFRLAPDSLEKAYGEPPQKLERSPGHYAEWLQACKGGQAAGSNFDWAGPLTEVVLMGNVVLRPEMREELTGKKLLWDPSPGALRFTNSENANQFLRREYRKGWNLGA